MSFAGGHSPFRPLQQSQTHRQQQSSRLRDSPMDFAYDSPLRQPTGSSSTWLDAKADNGASASKRSLDARREGEQAYIFGGEQAGANHSAGAFLFHQPLSPTVVGPDVVMAGDTPPSSKAKQNDVDDSHNNRKSNNPEGPRRRMASHGALMRVHRQRTAAASGTPEEGKRGAGKKAFSSQPRRRKASVTRSSKSIEDDDEDEGEADETGEWEDEQDKSSELRSGRRSLRKRVGDTLNIQYFFQGDGSGQVQQRSHSISAPASSVTLESRRNWTDPEWCLGMVQFGFNATLLLGIVWVLFNVVQTLQRDVASKVREYEVEYLAEIEACSQSYHRNRCGTDGAVPALASACAAWQRCSARDPTSVGRARVAAETVAEIVNGFVDVVSWKSMVFTLLTLIIVVGATNSFLSFFRIRSRQAQQSDSTSGTMIPPHGGYDPRSINQRQTASLGHATGMYDPYSHTWRASSPITPTSKRMCR